MFYEFYVYIIDVGILRCSAIMSTVKRKNDLFNYTAHKLFLYFLYRGNYTPFKRPAIDVEVSKRNSAQERKKK